jgi:hypothetical protein
VTSEPAPPSVMVMRYLVSIAVLAMASPAHADDPRGGLTAQVEGTAAMFAMQVSHFGLEDSDQVTGIAFGGDAVIGYAKTAESSVGLRVGGSAASLDNATLFELHAGATTQHWLSRNVFLRGSAIAMVAFYDSYALAVEPGLGLDGGIGLAVGTGPDRFTVAAQAGAALFPMSERGSDPPPDVDVGFSLVLAVGYQRL